MLSTISWLVSLAFKKGGVFVQDASLYVLQFFDTAMYRPESKGGAGSYSNGKQGTIKTLRTFAKRRWFTERQEGAINGLQPADHDW